jgi:hypothetical protein
VADLNAIFERDIYKVLSDERKQYILNEDYILFNNQISAKGGKGDL